MCVAMFICTTCKKTTCECTEPKENMYATKCKYECDKYRINGDSFLDNVIVELFETDKDSVVYIKEHTDYDINAIAISELKVNGYVTFSRSGEFKGVSKEWRYSSHAYRNGYVIGNISNDSLYMKVYKDYDTMPTVSDDSIKVKIITYKGVKIKDCQ